MTDHTPPLGPLPEPFEKAMRNFGIKCCYGGRAERLAAAEAIRSLHAMGGTLTADELPPPVAHIWLTGGTPVIYLHPTPDTEPLYPRAALDAVRAQERERWESALGAVMPADFKDWSDSPEDRPEAAAAVIRSLREREQMAWEQVAAAQAQERERCARIVDPGPLDDWEARGGRDGIELMRDLAAAIRAQDQG